MIIISVVVASIYSYLKYCLKSCQEMSSWSLQTYLKAFSSSFSFGLRHYSSTTKHARRSYFDNSSLLRRGSIDLWIMPISLSLMGMLISSNSILISCRKPWLGFLAIFIQSYRNVSYLLSFSWSIILFYLEIYFLKKVNG